MFTIIIIIINIIIVIIFESKPSECLSDPEGWTDQFATDFTNALKIGNRITALPFANKKNPPLHKMFFGEKDKINIQIKENMMDKYNRFHMNIQKQVDN